MFAPRRYLTLSFNPRRDLFLFATIPCRAEGCRDQSVSIPGGICSSLRLPLFWPCYKSFFVSIPGGICSSLRLEQFAAWRQAKEVSIPGGICSSLRLCQRTGIVLYGLCFNPRRDLFLFATPGCFKACCQALLFQSQAGFVPLCDDIFSNLCQRRFDVSIPGGICSSLRPRFAATKPVPATRFQSQAGFVPLCDSSSLQGNCSTMHVSIPGGICSSLRPRAK